MPGLAGFVLDTQRIHCILEIKDETGTFRFLNPSREKLIRELFSGPSGTFVAGPNSPEGVHLDTTETHPAWSAEAMKAVVDDELYGFNIGATIEDDN